MINRCTIVTIVMCCVVIISAAQQKNNRFVFHSQNQVAMINGNGAVSAGVQSVNGFGSDQWFAGIGVGLDFYRYRSVPLFADVKRYFKIANGNRLFIYGNGGYNLPWSEHNNQYFSQWSWPTKVDVQSKGGAYIDAGGGYAIQFKKRNALLLSVGYSHKYFSQAVTTTYWIGGVAGNVEQTEKNGYTYSFNRIMIKAGWQF